MKIFIGSDHAGFELKQKLIPFLRELGHEVEDKGAVEYKEDDDYPDFVIPVAMAVGTSVMPVSAHLEARPPRGQVRGIVIGGSGQGEAICANRFKGVRAVVFNGQYKPNDGREIPHEIELSRQHNDSNILSLGARFLNEVEAKEALRLWLETPFSGNERHARRIAKIDAIA